MSCRILSFNAGISYCITHLATLQKLLQILHILLITILTVAVITPLTYTAYLGQPDVKFHCFAVHARNVAWSIDGLIRHGNELKARGIETTTNHTLLESNLTISSTIENNNTRIRCLARHLVEHRFVPSEEVVFFVQGQQPKHTDSCCPVMFE